MTETIIDILYQENKELVEFLQENGYYSLSTNTENTFPKVLLLATASYFEDLIKNTLMDFFQQETSEPLFLFVKNKAIERQYHTFFDWKSKNANQFFGLFGDGFKKFMKEQIGKDERLEQAIRAFLEIGNTRNILVHENFGGFHTYKTTQEIYNLYQQALVFVEAFPSLLHTYIEHYQATKNE